MERKVDVSQKIINTYLYENLFLLNIFRVDYKQNHKAEMKC